MSTGSNGLVCHINHNPLASFCLFSTIGLLQTKFRLALACGNIEVAMHTAEKLPDDAIWQQLGTEALRQGNHQVRLYIAGERLYQCR